MLFLNRSFDKKRLKALLLWFRLNLSEGAALKAVEILQELGFRSATQGAISLGLDDLKTPASKGGRVFQAQVEVALAHHEHHRGNRTPVELFQHLVDTWHRTSQDLTTEVIQLFHSTERVNPVYMMAFSGARGNLSQVRQLVGMRGLMADPRGQIVGFPILSNFREGLTITEYFVSCYGARKGVVDTAIRTADAGYLTRRLADVSHHVVVRTTNCGTHRNIRLRNIKEGDKTILSLANRLVGRVLAEHVFITPIGGTKTIIYCNSEITPSMASTIASQHSEVPVRSPLSCSLPWGVCQLCYGWGLSEGRRVTLGEAVGIIAAQSIGEPGTQLTLRTFHTGGVFSGELLNEIRAPYAGNVLFSKPLQGVLLRTPHGQIAFLTKVSGRMKISEFLTVGYASSMQRSNVLSSLFPIKKKTNNGTSAFYVNNKSINYLHASKMQLIPLGVRGMQSESINFYAKQILCVPPQGEGDALSFATDNSFAYFTPYGGRALHDKNKSSFFTPYPIHASKMQLIPLGVRGKGVARLSAFPIQKISFAKDAKHENSSDGRVLVRSAYGVDNAYPKELKKPASQIVGINKDKPILPSVLQALTELGTIKGTRKLKAVEVGKQLGAKQAFTKLRFATLASSMQPEGGKGKNHEFFIQPSTVIFVKHKEHVYQNQLLAEFSSSTLQSANDQIEITQQVLSETAGQVWFKEIDYGNRKGPGSGSLGTHFSSQKLGGIWVLAGKPMPNTLAFTSYRPDNLSTSGALSTLSTSSIISPCKSTIIQPKKAFLFALTSPIECSKDTLRKTFSVNSLQSKSINFVDNSFTPYGGGALHDRVSGCSKQSFATPLPLTPRGISCIFDACMGISKNLLSSDKRTESIELIKIHGKGITPNTPVRGKEDHATRELPPIKRNVLQSLSFTPYGGRALQHLGVRNSIGGTNRKLKVQSPIARNSKQVLTSLRFPDLRTGGNYGYAIPKSPKDWLAKIQVGTRRNENQFLGRRTSKISVVNLQENYHVLKYNYVLGYAVQHPVIRKEVRHKSFFSN